MGERLHSKISMRRRALHASRSKRNRVRTQKSPKCTMRHDDQGACALAHTNMKWHRILNASFDMCEHATVCKRARSESTVWELIPVQCSPPPLQCSIKGKQQ